MSRATIALLGVGAVVVFVVVAISRRSDPTAADIPEPQAPVSSPAGSTSPAPQAPPSALQRSAALPTPEILAADEAARDEFSKDIQAFMEIHQRVAKQRPRVSDNATIEEIDRHQRGFLEALAAARQGAKRGDLWKPSMETAVRRMLVKVFEGVEGRQLRDSIMDENPRGITLTVNGRYPDQVPMATMPPEVLAALPKLPEELEYRFVGEALAIIDVPAHLVADYIPQALPRN